MRSSYILATVGAIAYAIWQAAYYWFWVPASLTTLQWAFWISVLGAICLIGALIFRQWRELAYIGVVITYIVSIILFIFHIWVLYSYMITYSIELWEILEIIDLMFLTNNNWIYPIVTIVLAAVATHYIQLYDGTECPELMDICSVPK